MKFRSDFVTNSSSSSYICEMCGADETAWEMPDWFVYCETCDTYLCESCIGDGDDVNGSSIETCPVCRYEEFTEHDKCQYLKLTYGVSWDEVFAIIKEQNKRRLVLRREEYVNHVMTKFGLTEEMMVADIRAKYATRHDFDNAVH